MPLYRLEPRDNGQGTVFNNFVNTDNIQVMRYIQREKTGSVRFYVHTGYGGEATIVQDLEVSKEDWLALALLLGIENPADE